MSNPVSPWTHTRVARPAMTAGFVRRAIWRGIRQRCPVCGQGKLFCGMFRMRDDCTCCGVSFTREPGLWLGSMDINLTISLAVVMAPIIFLPDLALPRALVFGTIGAIALPALLFRFVRGFWIALLFLSGAVY
jgi:uncharacterized protein (DUF983 family)